MVECPNCGKEVGDNNFCGNCGTKIDKSNVIAWLEKQGTSCTKEDVDDAYLRGISDAKNEIEKQYKANYQIRKDIATFIFNYRGDIKDRAKWMDYLGIKVSFVEKQGEKPQGKSALEAIKEEVVDNANKVEPKFGVGDFIADYYCRGKIVKITDDSYLLDTGQGIPFSCEHNTHLWTIKDAKNGDVLANDHHILILKELVYDWSSNGTPYSVKAYCGIKPNGNFEIGKDNQSFCGTLHIHPATKDQSDTLMKAMADAGYTFDFEKKELRNIEQNSLQWNISDYRTWQYIVSDVLTLHDGIGQYLDDGFCKNIAKNMQEEWSKKLSLEQNPAWSEEDEYIFGETIQHLEELIRIEKIKHFSVDVQYYQRDINWLKTIKQRLGGEK